MRKLMEERGAAAFYALKADLEEQVRQTEAGLAKPFDPRAFEPRAFK
jgi:antitoxin ParD1/3/4